MENFLPLSDFAALWIHSHTCPAALRPATLLHPESYYVELAAANAAANTSGARSAQSSRARSHSGGPRRTSQLKGGGSGPLPAYQRQYTKLNLTALFDEAPPPPAVEQA